MSKPAAKASKQAVLKGQEAENRVLEYIKRMNRPYGAVDVSANLKGSVPKTAAQKILASLAEKGDLVQKTYGKTVFFAPNQEKTVSLSADELKSTESRCSELEDTNKALIMEVKAAQAELARVRSAPSDADLSIALSMISTQQATLLSALEPLRSGAPALSADELAALDRDWIKWRGEWVRRRKVFTAFWGLATESLARQDADELKEDLGIDGDTEDHLEVEKSTLCVTRVGTGKR